MASSDGDYSTVIGPDARFKGALEFEPSDKAYLYRPLVTEETCARVRRRTLVKRVYDGAITPMLAAFIEDENLTPEEIAELRRLLDRKESGA